MTELSYVHISNDFSVRLRHIIMRIQCHALKTAIPQKLAKPTQTPNAVRIIDKNSSGDEIANVLVNDNIAHT